MPESSFYTSRTEGSTERAALNRVSQSAARGIEKNDDLGIDETGRGMGSSRVLMAIAAVSFLLVVFQTIDVVRKVQQLRGAYSENVQWSLSQSEVEFLT